MKHLEVATSTDVRENELLAVQVAGLSLIVTRVAGHARVVENKCSHLGWSMARGSVSGSTLKCPWHGSTFDVCSGQNLDWVGAIAGVPLPRWTRSLIALGKKPAPIRTFVASEESGRVFIDVPN